MESTFKRGLDLSFKTTARSISKYKINQKGKEEIPKVVSFVGVNNVKANEDMGCLAYIVARFTGDTATHPKHKPAESKPNYFKVSENLVRALVLKRNITT